jgi:hypothetical protein
LLGFASASASVNPKRLGLDKGYDSEPHRRALRQRRIVPIAPYRKNHVAIPRVARRKMSIIGAIAASGGRWSGRSVGSTAIDGWTACWNMARRLTGPSCESFSLNTIWMPYFPDPNEF